MKSASPKADIQFGATGGASAILDLLQHVRDLAEAEGESAMADHIDTAFNNCLAHHISENEARLAERISRAN